MILFFCLFVLLLLLLLFFIFYIGNTYFGLIWFKNSKLSVEAKIWSLISIEYIKLDGGVPFFCFRLFPFSILMLTN